MDAKWRLYNGHLQTTDHRPDGKFQCTRCPFKAPNPYHHEHSPCMPEICPFGAIVERAGQSYAQIKCSDRDVELLLSEVVWDPKGPGFISEHTEM